MARRLVVLTFGLPCPVGQGVTSELFADSHIPVSAKTQPSPTSYILTFKEYPTVANIKSQMKRIRTNEKRRVRNQAVKSELKTLVRKTREAVEAGDKEAAVEALRVVSRKLDKAVSKGVIHRNQAANRKSKLAKRVQSL